MQSQVAVSLATLNDSQHELVQTGKAASINLVDTQMREADRGNCLVAHADGNILGLMQIAYKNYPRIRADVPVICDESAFDAAAGALLSALKQETLRQCLIEAELIQDLLPDGSHESLASHLTAQGFRDAGQSVYMSKEINTAGSCSSIDPQLRLLTAQEIGIADFLRAMVKCSQPPLTDPRLQQGCCSIEGAAMIIRDLAGDDSGTIDESLNELYVAYLDNTAVAVAIASPGFVKWIAVSPDARHSGIGRAVLLSLEKIWSTEGVTRCGLQVMSTNTRAAGLYSSLGYQSHGENSPRIWKWHVG